MWFQSTLSVKRATYARRDASLQQIVSIHALSEESDVGHNAPYPYDDVSIHALSEESDLPFTTTDATKSVSIHALSEESDAVLFGKLVGSDVSIHALSEESDCSRSASSLSLQVSIHALSEESDMTMLTPLCATGMFQSTLSVKRATLQPSARSCRGHRFNPRSQ